MLLSLLPFSAWAQADYVIEPTDITYGSDADAIMFSSVAVSGATLTETTSTPTEGEYTVDRTKVYTDEACTTEVSGFTSVAKLPVSENFYYVKIQAYGYSTFKGGAFKVKKANLVAYVNGSTPYDYKAPTAKSSLEFTKGTAQVLINAGEAKTTVAGTLTYALGSTTGISNAADVKATDAGTYTVTYTFAGDANHNPATGQFDVTIAQKTLSTPTVTGLDNVTYNAKDQTPSAVKVTFGTGDDKVEFTDATVTYYKESIAEANKVTELKNAGEYLVQIVAPTTGNYTFATISDKTFKINRKAMKVNVKDDEKTYDGTGFTLSTAYVQFQGLIGSDAEETVNGITFKVGDTDAISTDSKKGEYKVKAVIDASTFTYKDNYEATVGYTGTMVINPRAVTITPKAQSTTYGDDLFALPTSTMTSSNYATYLATIPTGTASTGAGLLSGDSELNDVLGGIELKWASETPATAYKAKGEYPEAIVLSVKNDYAGNYDITPGTAATYTVDGIKFALYAKDCELTYGDAQTKVDALDFYGTSGLVGKLPGDASVAYKLQTAAGVDINIADALATPADYQIFIDKENTNIPAFGNYTGAEIDDTPATLKINKKSITITPKAVTVNAGASVSALNQLGGINTIEGLVGSDEIAWKLAFNTDGTGAVIVDATTGNLTSAANATPYAAGVKVEAATDSEADKAAGYWDDSKTYANDKYIIDWKTAALTVGTANTLALADGDADILTKIALAGDGEDYTVTVDRDLNVDQWNVLVLPFDITPYEFIQAFGRYAIFNTLSSANTDNNTVSFKLELNQMKANEPFLVKPQQKTTETKENLKDHAFADVKVKKVTATDGNPAKTDVAGVKFVGAYKPFTLTVAEGEAVDGYVDGADAGKKISYLSKGNFVYAVSTDGTKSRKNLNVTFTRGYLDFNGSSFAAPLITVEEADGSTTVISAITSDGTAVKAEGWYNLNGVKLQGAPTQKGVYIQNGKKIIVK